MALIWFLSSYPSDAIVDTGLSFDDMLKESLHLIEFGCLSLLWVIALKANKRLNPKTNLAAAIVSILYALADEIHQSFVPQRSATIIDFIKDFIGITLTWYLVNHFYLKSRFKKRRKLNKPTTI